MKNLISKLEKETMHEKKEYILNNPKLSTKIHCITDLYNEEINEFSKAFNNLFKSSSNKENIINNYIIENNEIFEEALTILKDNNNLLKTTQRLQEFNEATKNTSLAKCDNNNHYYIMRCYEYFIYIFDKINKKSYMIIKDNKKVVTMINILLLTPYLMYGELFAVHGGLVNKEKNNILINNSSLGGKTTFAILFASNGYDIITEETTYITKEGNILPFNIRNYFNIRVGTYLNFLDFFKSKNIIIDEFIKMNNKSKIDLYNAGKEGQKSIDFNKIGVFKELSNTNITTTLKVSIEKDESFSIEKCNPVESVNAFLELSLAPTVMLFKELLLFDDINIGERKKQLETIFRNTNSLRIKSGFDYKENFEKIIKNI